MKYVFAGVWLAGSVLGARSPAVRRLFAYGGSILAMVHICALAFGLLDQKWNARPVSGGNPIGGFLAGIAVGLVLGAILGVFAYRAMPVYWIVQLTAVAFLIFLPLLRF